MALDLKQPLAPLAPYTLTVRYDPAEALPSVAGELALFRWDGEAWLREPTGRVDVATRTVTATPSAWGLWTVAGPTWRVFLPLVRRP